MNTKHLLYVLTLVLLISSCDTTKKIVYLQDLTRDSIMNITNAEEIKAQPNDKLSIIVSSKNSELAMMYNLPIATVYAGTGNVSSYNQIQGYTVDNDGNIGMPVVGTIHIGGLTRSQIASTIQKILIKEGLLNDPTVTVDFMNIKISVLGEVAHPGRYSIERNQITLLEALSLAGDLTITGRRDKVHVLREEGSKRLNYTLDLRSKDIFQSPVYYLRQNDIIIVEPNRMRAGQSTINDNTMQSASMWISIASFLASLGTLLFK